MVKTLKSSSKRKPEEQLYEPIKIALQKELEKFVGTEGKVHLEVTANGRFSEDLKEALDDRALGILRVERFSPDLTGFVQRRDSTLRDLITVEIKPDKIKINHIYRAKLYADVLNARYGLLVSPRKIPEEIRRFVADRYSILYRSSGPLIIAQFDRASSKFEFDKKIHSTIPEPFKPTT